MAKLPDIGRNDSGRSVPVSGCCTMWQDRDRMNKVREKLNWPLFQDVHLWQRIKPKGMHYKTFYSLVKEHDFYEMSYLCSFGATIPSLFTKLNDIKKTLKATATK